MTEPAPSMSMFDWVQLGAVGVLAILNILELRAVRPLLQDIRVVLAALLERDRIRSERKKEPSGPVPEMSSGVPDGQADDADTGLVSIIKRQTGRRLPTPVSGVRHPRPGTHHDE